MELIKTRTIGIEMEGYIEAHPIGSGMDVEASRLGCDVKRDESLYNCYWEEDYDDNKFGIELNTAPMTDLSKVYGIVRMLNDYGWSTDSRAGTHIHIDIRDFTEEEKAKLLRFGKGIERIIFLFVNDNRYNNDFCKGIHKEWRKVFWKKSKIFKKMNWEKIDERGGLRPYLHDNYDMINEINNYKYSWINILSSQHGTAEFRLFHAMESADEIIKQANLAYSIVELVKNSSIEQLEFILKEIYKESTVEAIVEKLFQALNIEEVMPIVGLLAYEKFTRKLERRAERAARAEELQAV